MENYVCEQCRFHEVIKVYDAPAAKSMQFPACLFEPKPIHREGFWPACRYLGLTKKAKGE